MEKKTTCPLCKDLSNNCVVEQTIIDENPFESYICFKCGMTTNTHFALDSEHLEKMTENNTQLMNDLKIIDDERGLVWYPSVINMGEKGIIYPDGEEHDWYWNYASVIEVPEEEREQYDGHDKRLDIENPQKFGQFEFMEACQAMGVIVSDG
jgi:hypothetical protein